MGYHMLCMLHGPGTPLHGSALFVFKHLGEVGGA